MSRVNRRITAAVLACLAAGLFYLGRARAEDPDLLRDAAARQKVLTEQQERDIRDAADEALKLARTQPAKAADQIKQLLLLVDANTNFTADKKDSLTAILKRDLNQIQSIALNQIQSIADGVSVPNPGSGFHPPAPDPKAAEEQKRLIDNAVSRITSTKEALADAADIRAKKAAAIGGLLTQVDRSSIPETQDIRFPDNWRELSMRRLKDNSLTDTERAILKALAATVSVDFKDQRFGGVVSWFEHEMGQTIILDKPALDDIGVNNESTVNVTLNKVSTRTALKKVLADLGLTYVIKDETIFVTTPAKAKDMMTVRTYYIGDLVGGFDLRFGPTLSQYQALATVAQLVQMIQNNVDPESWAVNGKDGGGSIVFDPVHMTLVVRQSAEVHYKMMQGLVP